MRIVFLVIFALLVLMLVFLGVYLIIGYSLYKKHLICSKKSIKVKTTDENEDFYKDYETLTIESFDNLKLNGYYKDNNSERLAIVVHGLTNSAYDMEKYVELFLARGYDILAIDSRAHGNSEGKEFSLGLKESVDLCDWIKLMVSKKPSYKIALFGISMGASTVCMTIGEKIESNVILAISDCAYDNAEKELKYLFSRQKFFPKLLYKIFYIYTKKTRDLDLKKIDVVSSLKNNKLPVLFIHGDMDKVVPIEMVYKLAEQVPEQRRKMMIVNGAGHCESYDVDKYNYKKTLYEFLMKYNM